MKIISSRIKELRRGGYFSSGHCILNLFLNDDGKEVDLGDLFITEDNARSKQAEIEAIVKKYKALGYEEVPDK